MIGGGLALMILPTMVVGNELLILGGVLGLVVVWFFAYRHGNICAAWWRRTRLVWVVGWRGRDSVIFSGVCKAKNRPF